MKKIPFVLFLFTAVQFYSVAQESQTKVNELGITFNSFNSFGLRYKTGNEKTLLRLTLLSLNGSNSQAKPDTLGSSNTRFGAGLNIGFEKRKSITDKLVFYYGLDLLSSYNKNVNRFNAPNETTTITSSSVGLGVVLGLNYNINQHFLIAAEIVPNVSYNYLKNETLIPLNKPLPINSTYTNSGLSYGLNNLGANVTLTYRFGKKQ